MYELRTEIEIQAPAEVVWGLLTKTEAYPGWNPFVRQILGRLAVGEKLAVKLAPPGSKPMTFRPTVQRVEPGRRFTWLGHLGMPMIFDGEHSFEIEPITDGSVRFVHSERFSGVLVPFLRKSLDTTTRAGFESMNRALKTRAEARAAERIG